MSDIMLSPKKATEEFKNLYPYRLELHAHSSPASGCSEVPADELVRVFKEAGYDGIALTNHFIANSDYTGSKENTIEMFKKDIYLAQETGDKLGIKVYAGAELRFHNHSNNDYLFFGYTLDELPDIFDYLNTDLETFVKEYKKESSLLIQAHPFRNNMIRMNSDLLDAIEAFNVHQNHNSRVAVAAKYAAAEGKIMTVGSDYHHPGFEGISATRTKTLPKDESELISIIKNEDFIMEIGGRILL
ncbi:MAG: PHP domain-containing protein [Clostridia bacterium]|nr:PHP domain-containing protein [Clostridia bacterium]